MYTAQLAIDYVRTVAERNLREDGSKQYLSIQERANHSFFRVDTNDEQEELESVLHKELGKSVEAFTNEHQSHKVQDYIFKSDQMTPRKMHLLSPLYYLYYTKLSFDIAKKIVEKDDKQELDLSRENMRIFYMGKFSLEENDEKRRQNANYKTVYNEYVSIKEEYIGKPAVKLDVQNFFLNISVKKLIEKLEIRLGACEEVDNLRRFFEVCDFHELPQLHDSIASSLLSQLYLHDFDNKVEAYLEQENIEYVRLVDDMYFIFEEDCEKKKNELNNAVIEFLWEDGLFLNQYKTRFYNVEQYEKNIENRIGENDLVSSNQRTVERAEEVIENGDFITFIEEIQKLIKKNGLDQRSYRQLLKQYIAVKDSEEANEGSHSREVLEHIIFNRAWEGKLTMEQMDKVTGCNEYIKLSPFHLTTLYVMVSRYLEEKAKEKGEKVTEPKIFNIYNQLISKQLDFKESVMVVAYQLLNKYSINEEVISGFKNTEYQDYIRTFFNRRK